MIKQNKKLLLLTSVITLLPVFIGLFLWNQLPDSVATHFGLNNQPDGYLYIHFLYLIFIKYSINLPFHPVNIL